MAQQISDFTVVGNAGVNRYANNSAGFTWSDGTPTATANNSTTGVFIIGQGNGFRITAPADTTVKTLRVYVGAWHTQGLMTAQLSDGSAPAYTDTSLSNTVSPTSLGVYTFTYQAASRADLDGDVHAEPGWFRECDLAGGHPCRGGSRADFSLSAAPPSQSVVAGAKATYTATVAALNGFSGTAGFSVSGLPPGVTAGFNPATVTGSGSSTLTLTTTSGASAGTYPLTITGTSGSLVHTASVALTVIKPATGGLSGSMATP